MNFELENKVFYEVDGEKMEMFFKGLYIGDD